MNTECMYCKYSLCITHIFFHITKNTHRHTNTFHTEPYFDCAVYYVSQMCIFSAFITVKICFGYMCL